MSVLYGATDNLMQLSSYYDLTPVILLQRRSCTVYMWLLDRKEVLWHRS